MLPDGLARQVPAQEMAKKGFEELDHLLAGNNRDRCSQALHILDRFHIVAKMNEALDEVRGAEARKLAQDGHEPLLKKTRWCVLKRKQNLTGHQRFRLRDLLRYNRRTVRAYLLKKAKVTMRKSDGFRTFRITEIALYRALGKLPEPELTHDFH
jgi:transposase